MTADAGTNVRGAALLAIGGRRSAGDGTLVVAAGVLLGAPLGGFLDVTGRRRLGVDRRRLVPGPRELDDQAPPLMVDVVRRVRATTPDTPWGWCERAAVFAFDAVAG